MARHYVGRADPSTPEEYADALYNAGAGITPEVQRRFRNAYVAAMTADGSLDQQIQEQAQMAVASALNVSKGEAPGAASALRAAAAGSSARKAAMYNRRAPGVKADQVFADSGDMLAGDFFQAVGCRRGPNRQLDDKLSRLADIQNSFGSEVPDAGGFLVPELLRSQLLAMSLETGVVRPRATVIPMSTLRVPVPMLDDTSHATNVFGGVQFYWTEEAAAITESQATFGRVVLDAKKLAGLFAVPNELLADAPAFSGFFESRVPQAHAWFEDLYFLQGTGVSEPMGLVNCEASINVTKQTGQLTNTIVWENIVGMFSRMLPTSLNRAIWICNIDTFPQLATMALAVGVGGGPVWIGNFAGGIGGADSPPATILGRPVYFTEKTPQLSTAGDIIFCDPSYYLIGDRMQLELSSSPHYYFAQDKTGFRLLSRVDGRPWLQSALTAHSDSSNTLSAFVQLQSR